MYFSVAAAPEYGRLSGARLEDMVSQESSALQAGSARLRALEVAEAARGRRVGLAVGSGSTRAGTSSARQWSEKHLGPEFEIHGGGLDLRFPHHENELAQSSALGHRFAHVWMHNGMLELDAEKMSKSLGNVVTLRNVLDTLGS